VFGLQLFCDKVRDEAQDSKGKRTCRNVDVGQNRYQENGGTWAEIIMENLIKNLCGRGKKQKIELI
jgi:hypothetical protein